MTERTSALGQPILVFNHRDSLLDEMAGRFIEVMQSLPSGARIVLAGGSTPLPVYERIASRRIDWNRFWFLISDERCVPPDHPDSNFGRISSVLLNPLGIQNDRVVRFLGEKPAERAAEIMHRELIDMGQRVPLFDLVLLGLGGDGHTASLFPAPAWPDFGAHLAAATRHPDGSDRLTMTPLALRSSARTFFLVSGPEKKDAVARTLSAASPSSEYPATMVAGLDTRWFLDADAALSLQ
ncbi:MAG TPA: 6-phosphogluconolactonase, partial [Candidatus Eisenbacteria bacterium]|nr:6-phosphogluconolactonase [Candidatus Eisenbacteria bacterium]